ncbi:MAG: hypothetical protein HYS87_02180 [Candidatus Colwellbacteria bacterium]|nr:hypothetical protein [Candidatus Colwellbacteria bacterium]
MDKNQSTLTSAKPVGLESLGICEHCKTIVSIEGMPPEAMDTEWRCPNCNGVMSHKSFGYESETGGEKMWVGPNGDWVTEKPKESFEIGGFYAETTRSHWWRS